MTFNTKTDADLTNYVKAIEEMKHDLPERLTRMGVDDISIKKFDKLMSFLLEQAGESEAFEFVKTESGRTEIEFKNEGSDTVDPSIIVAIKVTGVCETYEFKYRMKEDTLLKRRLNKD